MTVKISLYDLLNRFDAFGGVERVGQAGFCLWYALIRKSNKLNWAGTFSMTNAELIYTGGFSSEKALWQVRNKLIQMGLIEYEAPPRGKTMPGRYTINFDFDKQEEHLEENVKSYRVIEHKKSKLIPNCFPTENTLETLWESLRKQLGSSLGNINIIRQDKINIDYDYDSAAQIFSEILALEFNRSLLPEEIRQAKVIVERVSAFANGESTELLQEAVKRCTMRGVTNLNYLASIVENWGNNRLASMQEISEFEKAEKINKSKGHRKSVITLSGNGAKSTKSAQTAPQVPDGKYESFYL